MRKQSKHTKRFYNNKLFLKITGSILLVILLIIVAFRVSPWPGAMLIRYEFNKGGAKTLKAMEKHQPSKPVSVLSNQQYQPDEKMAVLDVYFPADTKPGVRLPTVIWTHGGAWLSGDKSDDAPYFKLLAAEGFSVIGLNYSLAPERTYPTAVNQLNDAYAFVQAHAEKFHVDADRFILAGDSAGAQLSSQMGAIVTSPDYANQVGISPSLKPSQLRGLILNCGIYMMDGLTQPDPTLPKIVGWGDDISVWAYSGTKDFSDPVIKEMSAYYHVTKDYPRTYISGGNGDPLTKAQSKPFATLLTSIGVNVTQLFFPNDYKPALPHEYQFNLDTAAGKQAFQATVQFIKQVTV